MKPRCRRLVLGGDLLHHFGSNVLRPPLVVGLLCSALADDVLVVVRNGCSFRRFDDSINVYRHSCHYTTYCRGSSTLAHSVEYLRENNAQEERSLR